MADSDTTSIMKGVEPAAFDTAHLLKNIRGRTVSSAVITITAQGAKFALTMASTMVLARLLIPTDFGQVAMVTTVTGFLTVFKDAGLSTATVQREHISHAQVSNLFWINVAVSIVCTMVVAVLAPVVAWFYREPALLPITLALSLTFLVSGATVQHRALLTRQMRFKALAAIDISSMIIATIIGIAMAWRGFGSWALVGSSLMLEVAGLILTLGLSRWRPQWPSRNSGIRPMVGFGANLTAASFLYSLVRGGDSMLLGRFYGAEAVGVYSRAGALLMRPIEQFVSPIAAVIVPTLSRLQSEPERYRRTFMLSYRSIALVWFPFTAMLLALSQPITLLLLGPKWGEAGTIFAGFTFAALYAPLASASTWLLHSQARGGDWVRVSSILSTLTVVSFFAGLPFGPLGVAIAFSASGLVIRLPILYYWAGRSGPVAARDLWSVFFQHLPTWGAVFAATSLISSACSGRGLMERVILSGLVGVLVATSCIMLFPIQRKTGGQLFSMLRELLPAWNLRRN